jgi:hypothetical protein
MVKSAWPNPMKAFCIKAEAGRFSFLYAAFHNYQKTVKIGYRFGLTFIEQNFVSLSKQKI